MVPELSSFAYGAYGAYGAYFAYGAYKVMGFYINRRVLVFVYTSIYELFFILSTDIMLSSSIYAT